MRSYCNVCEKFVDAQHQSRELSVGHVLSNGHGMGLYRPLRETFYSCPDCASTVIPEDRRITVTQLFYGAAIAAEVWYQFYSATTIYGNGFLFVFAVALCLGLYLTISFLRIGKMRMLGAAVAALWVWRMCSAIGIVVDDFGGWGWILDLGP